MNTAFSWMKFCARYCGYPRAVLNLEQGLTVLLLHWFTSRSLFSWVWWACDITT